MAAPAIDKKVIKNDDPLLCVNWPSHAPASGTKMAMSRAASANDRQAFRDDPFPLVQERERA